MNVEEFGAGKSIPVPVKDSVYLAGRERLRPC